MVELLTGFPHHVAAYRATGEVVKEEYEQVVMQRVNQVAAQFWHCLRYSSQQELTKSTLTVLRLLYPQ